MIVARFARSRISVRAYQASLGAYPPPPQEFRSSQIVSNAIWDKIFACDKTIITILNFKISGGGLEFLPPPLYETLAEEHEVIPKEWLKCLTYKDANY